MPSADFNRRSLLTATIAGAAALCFPPALALANPAEAPAGPSPAEALARLKAGNARFLAGGAALHPASMVGGLAKAQHPYAVIVSCADSRVAPELLFSTGLGELFVVRNAGHSVTPLEMGGIEYAVEHLGAPLIVVLGHERCGAVNAAVEVATKGTALPASLGAMVAPIVPTAREAVHGISGAEATEAAVQANVRRVVDQLRHAPGSLLEEPLEKGRLMIVGARYDLDEGRVTFIA
ncbi:carbonic anhydrase [Sphingomonas ginkgonis]|nr:carbonic anhydrase [Sphingomonas ginkgonis]